MEFINQMMASLQEENTLLSDITELLINKDPSFKKIAADFSSAKSSLMELLDNPSYEIFDQYLSCENHRISDDLLCLFWNGAYQNLLCFQNPINKLFLQLDFETIHKEYLLHHSQAAMASDASYKLIISRLNQTQIDLLEKAEEYYCSLETLAYKIAHFYGFLFGDKLLPKVIPGYVPDMAITSQYTILLNQFLGFTIVQS